MQKDRFTTGQALIGVATVVGGGTSEDITIAGAAVGDSCIVSLNSNTNASVIEKAVVSAANTVTVTFDTDPGAGTATYLIVKPI